MHLYKLSTVYISFESILLPRVSWLVDEV